jgi:hypothetical protein
VPMLARPIIKYLSFACISGRLLRSAPSEAPKSFAVITNNGVQSLLRQGTYNHNNRRKLRAPGTLRPKRERNWIGRCGLILTHMHGEAPRRYCPTTLAACMCTMHCAVATIRHRTERLMKKRLMTVQTVTDTSVSCIHLVVLVFMLISMASLCTGEILR